LRIGQGKDVHVKIFVTKDTIEEDILAKYEKFWKEIES